MKNLCYLLIAQGGSIFDIRALWYAQPWASECPDVKNYKWWLKRVWHRMFYSCAHMATVGVKGLMAYNGKDPVFFGSEEWHD